MFANWDVPDFLPKHLDFTSNYNPNHPGGDKERMKYTVRAEGAKIGAIQMSICLVIVLLNHFFWLSSKKFDLRRHMFHYYLACFTFMMYIPRELWRGMAGPKFSYTCVNVFIYNLLITTTYGVSSFHQSIVMLSTIAYEIIIFKRYFKIVVQPVCVWDGYLHVFIPCLLVIGYSIINTRKRLQDEQSTMKELDDLKTIVGQISSGIALTNDFHSIRKAKRAKEKKTQSTQSQTQSKENDIESGKSDKTQSDSSSKSKKPFRIQRKDILLANVEIYKLLSNYQPLEKKELRSDEQVTIVNEK